ncbi:MAG: hypothetical protein GY898_06035 [Proteobacteria bacterium]|nr:hypothetical protein [Pseudomonadota bacterium]
MIRLSAALVLISSFLVASTAFADPAEDRIRALTEPPAQSEWDARVLPIVLANYDLDGSGAVNKNIEVDGIPCGTWAAMDEAVKAGWGYGLRVIYGFEADKLWVGSAIGFDESIRAYGDSKLVGCGLLGDSTPAPTPTPAPTTSAGSDGATAQAIRNALPGMGGSSEWDTAVRKLMVSAFDSNRSGSIDTTGEVVTIGCDVAVALDDRVKEKWQHGVRTIYGFEADKIWIGQALGFDESVRSGADVHIAGCLAKGGSTSTPTTAPPATTTSTNSALVAAIRAVPDGGSSEWDGIVKKFMVADYDKNGSRTLDTPAEVSSVGCDVWKAIDDGVKQSYSYGVRPIYGFEAGYSWIGGAIGFAETMRTNGDSALVGCGLHE